MNIKAKLIIAATAVSLLSTPALAFRDMGDAGGDSAFAVPEHHGYSAANRAYRYNRYAPDSAYASGQYLPPRYYGQPSYDGGWYNGGWGGWNGYQGWAGGHNDW